MIIISSNRGYDLEVDLAEEFRNVDTEDFPDFYVYKKPLEMGLWILWVAKEKLGVKRLTAEQLALIIRGVKEISIEAKSITNSFNRAEGKVHTHHEGGNVYFEIMKPGKDHLMESIREGPIEIFMFEPGKRYSSKKILAENILVNFQGQLRILDPYCGERTLGILHKIKNSNVKFLTRIENLQDKDRKRLLLELKDFKLENPNIEIRNYPNTDIHDRYIITSEQLAILGHSIKDLGGKESFAIILSKDTNKNIFEALMENFNRKWKQSTSL